MEGLSLLDKITLAFNPDQERDENGKWTSGGGDIKGADPAAAFAILKENNAKTPAEVATALRDASAVRYEFSQSNQDAVYVVDADNKTYVVKWNGSDNYTTVVEAHDWISQQDLAEFYPNYEQEWNNEFWNNPQPLFHGTEQTNIESVMRDGLEARDETRGMSNRWEGLAVYTSTEPDEAKSYYETILKIDTAAMKADGVKPFVSREPDVVRAELQDSLAYSIDVTDWNSEVESGMSYTTVVVSDSIPAKYLSSVDNLTAAFNPDQERDENGKWTSGESEPKTGKVNISEIKPEADLSGRDLSGMDLSDMDLNGANLSAANLTNANLTYANLTNADLSDAIMFGANLKSAHLDFAGLRGARLFGANLQNASLQSAHLDDASLEEANLTYANLSYAYLTNANLIEANLEGANLTGAHLDSAFLRVANLSGANLYGADLQNADLTLANLKGADLTGVELRNAILPESVRTGLNEDLLEKAITSAKFDPQNAEQIVGESIKPPNTKWDGDWLEPFPVTVLGESLDFNRPNSGIYSKELKEEVERQIADSALFGKGVGAGLDSFSEARNYTDSWQRSANSGRNAEMIQESASRVLVGQEATLPDKWQDLYQGQSTQAELVVFQMYQRTQIDLAGAGYKPDDTIRLYRGVKAEYTETFDKLVAPKDLLLRPLSSWSADPLVAARFANDAGTVWAAEVPVANIVATPFTGFGCYNEKEVIVLDKPANNLTAAFNPDQERDENGKWTSGGGEPKTGKVDPSEIVPNADLRGRDLRDMNLTGMDLTGVNLNGANLLGAQVIGADLSGTNLLGANLSLTNLTGAHFTGADLTGAMMLNATLTDTDLTGANLTKVDFQYSELKNVDFTDANLTDANFQYSELKNVDFTDAIVTGADFTGVNLNKVTMSSEQRLEIKQEIEDLKTADGRAVKEVTSAIKEELGKKDAGLRHEEFERYESNGYAAEIYKNDGTPMGNMSFSVNDGTLEIGNIRVRDEFQGEGTATVIQQAVINEAFDPQNRIDFVSLHANSEHGGYAWAETSYPTDASWRNLRGLLELDVERMKETDDGKKIDFSNVEKALASEDPRSIQTIHDDKTLLPDSLVTKSTKGNELGRELLLGSSWHAIMPTDPETLANAQRRLAASGATDRSSWMPDVPERDLSEWLPWPCYVREDGSVTDDGIWEDFSDAKRTRDFSYWPITLAFNPDQERDENGRWTSSGETTDKEAEKIVNAVLQNEGYSVKPLTGEVPMSGYMVAVPNTSHVVSSEDFFNKQNTDKVADSLDDFMEKHEAAFDDGAWLGLWYSKETSEIVYDVVDQIENREEAVAQGVARDQISIYDVVNGVEIQTGGTGGLTASGQARSFHNPTGQKMVGNDFGRKTNMDSFGSRAFRGGSKETLAFNPDQPRDADGKWASGSTSEPKTGKVDISEIVPNADLSGRDLLSMDLSGRDLSGINFTGARLFRANLEGANLTGANLTDANLRHADLTAADLTNANFTDANLTESNLNEADLINTNLTNADLTGAIAIKADLNSADLSGANLTDIIGMSPSMQYANSKNESLLAEAKATINTDGIKDFATQIIYEESPVSSDDAVTPPPKEGSPEWRLWENQLDRDPIDLKVEVENQVAASAVFSTSHQTNESLLTPREYADTWADNSNDNRESEAIQESASRVLLNQEAPLPEGWEDHYKGQSDQVELVMLKMYERTQSYLSDQGYKEDDTLTLYRGVQMEFGDRPPSWEVDTPLQLRPLSSWSTEFEVARGFLKDNGYILEAEVPITNIVSLPMTGLGCLNEKEVVVGRPNSQSTLDNLTAAFDPNQERDENGRWTSSGGTDTETFLGRDGSEKIANIADPDMARYARTNADLIRENTPKSSYQDNAQFPADEVFKRNDWELQQIASRTWAATFQQCEDITIAADNLLGFATQDREWSEDVQFGRGEIDTNAPVYAQEMLDALTKDSPNNESYESALFNIKENWDPYGLEKVLVGENTDVPYAMRGINNNTGFMDSLDLAFQEKENVGWSLASFVPAGDFAARMRSEEYGGELDEQSAISIAKGFQSTIQEKMSDTEPERVGLIHLTNGSALAVSTDSFEIVTGGEFKIVDRLTGPQAIDYLENLAQTAADYADDIGYSDQTVYVMEQVALPDYERGD